MFSAQTLYKIGALRRPEWGRNITFVRTAIDSENANHVDQISVAVPTNIILHEKLENQLSKYTERKYCISCSSGTDALTLIDGIAGQLKIITMISYGGVATLTPSTLNGYTTIAFGTDGDCVMLLFTDATNGWSIISNQGCTLA